MVNPRKKGRKFINNFSILRVSRIAHLASCILHLKGSFPCMTNPTSNLVMVTIQVNFREPTDFYDQVKHVIKSRYKNPILNCDIVDGTSIYTHSLRFIPFSRLIRQEPSPNKAFL